MEEIGTFGAIVFVVGAAFAVAVLAAKLTRRVPIPTPALFLIAAAVSSDVFPHLQDYLSIRDVTRLGVVALVVILFHGGMSIGWPALRRSLAPTLAVGVLGTFATAAIIAGASHWLLGFGWITSGIIGAAIAPTDPAVMFSVLGGREIAGRSGTILEGESGVNDPVGIALMVGMIELATHDDASFTLVIKEFAIEMAVGAAVGIALGRLLLLLNNRVSLPSLSLYPLLLLACAATIYGAAALLHGSGFLAVFIAGLIAGRANLTAKHESERFHAALASLAEIVVFVALGLTIDVTDLAHVDVGGYGLLLAVILAAVARPAVVLPILAPSDLQWGERLFIAWAGLKGAVPILLAAFAVLGQIEDADRLYLIVFVVVIFSVAVQGTAVPAVAARLGVQMIDVDVHALAGAPPLQHGSEEGVVTPSLGRRAGISPDPLER
jgi:cell volume regulation protein A